MFARVHNMSRLLSPWVIFASGTCSPVVAVLACHCRVMFARNRCYTIVGYVYALSVLTVLSPWAVFAPGSCSPVCTPCLYRYRRGLRSHRGHVRPCVQPVATVIAVGYFRIGVMFARGRCYRLPFQGLGTLLVLLLYLMSVPRPSARALPGETDRYGCGLCSHVPAVIACCRHWTLFLVLCRATQSTFGTRV